MVEFGLILTSALLPDIDEHEVFDRDVSYSIAAEEAGYADVWLFEHHFTPFGICGSPLTVASHIAAKTTTLKIGSAVCVVPMYHPVRLAEEIAMLDHLSHGRFNFGVGRGGARRDFEAFHVDAASTHLYVYETIEILKRAWVGKSVEWDSELINLPDVRVLPRSYTQPHPPIYIACQSPSTIEYAARNCFPMLLINHIERERIVSNIELFNSVAEEEGYDGSQLDHIALGIAFVADTTEEAYETVLPAARWWSNEERSVFFTFEDIRRLDNYNYFRQLHEQRALRGDPTEDMGTEAYLQQWLGHSPVGSPEKCIDQLNELVADTGLRHVALAIEGANDRARTIEAMQRFAAEVFPSVRKEWATAGTS